MTGTLVRYGCGCIGFPLDHPLTQETPEFERGKPTGKTVKKPCIIRACNGDTHSDDINFICCEIMERNLGTEPLSPKEEIKIWNEIAKLISDGYRARDLKHLLQRIMK